MFTTVRTTDITIPPLKLKILPSRFLIGKFGEELIERSVFELSFFHIIAWLMTTQRLVLIWKFCRVFISSYAFIFSVLRIILMI